MKKLLPLLLLLLATPASAADNALVITPGIGVPIRCKDVGTGIQSCLSIPGDLSGNPAWGTAGVPNANVLTVQGILSGTAFPVLQSGTWTMQQGGTWTVQQGSPPWSVTQSGTWTVQPGNTANTTAWLVTGTGGTFPVTQVGAWSVNQGAAGASPWPITGNASNGSDNVGSVAVNVPAISYNYIFNGSTWDRMQGDGSKNVKVNCVVGCSSSGGSSLADEGVYTQGVTSFTVGGGIFNTSITNLTSGQAGAVQMTADRNYFVNLNKVAGVAIGTPVAFGSTPTGNAIPTNTYVVNTNTNNQKTMAGSSPVVIASDQTPVPVTVTAPADPCTGSLKSTASFSSTTSGGQIIAAAAAKKTYLCGISVVSSTAAAVSIIEGTGSSVCTGGTPAGVWGNTGTTAANGFPFGANGGIALGSGNGTVAGSATVNQNICLIFTTTNTPTVVATVTYVQQ